MPLVLRKELRGLSGSALDSCNMVRCPLGKKVHVVLPQRQTHTLYTLGYFASSLSHWEGDFAWKPLTNGTFRIEGRRGHSGYGLPFFMVRNEITGETFVSHLEWSGNWYTDSCAIWNRTVRKQTWFSERDRQGRRPSG